MWRIGARTVTDDVVVVVQRAFDEFERTAVRVPDDQIAAAQDVHPQIRSVVAKELDLPRGASFLSGSYARRVQAHHVHDIDVIIVVPDADGSFRNDPLEALEAIRAGAKASDLVRLTRLAARSVKLFLSAHDFTVDLVAALEVPGTDELDLAFHIPDEGVSTWTRAHPRGQTRAIRAKNAQCDRMFVPCVRLVKSWNRHVWGHSKSPLRSYHAEAILHLAFDHRLDYADAIHRFFQTAFARLAPGVQTPDPGFPRASVDDRMDDDERQRARDAVERALEHVERARAAVDAGEALNAWAQVFGPSFPAPCNDAARLRTALQSGGAGAKGDGLVVAGGRRLTGSRSWRPTG